MRWDSLRLDSTDGDDNASAPTGHAAPSGYTALPLIERGAVTRTFDTPGFRGLTFYEVQAKSIVSEVPKSSRMMFRYTINPYRGCSHSCVYCLSGETPILMADGTAKPIADVRVGDAIYGTVREGSYRRYKITEVQAHWSTVKSAYRITLEDGTSLVASGDHRFLSDRGWKHVTGAEQGPEQRPFLTTNDKLMGFGGFAEAPRNSLEYQRGYLCGMIRTAAPAITRKRSIAGKALKSEAKLRVASIEPLGLELPMYDITTGTGDFIANGVVSHNCFARNSHTYLDLDAGHDFDSKVVVKVNAPELLRAKLASPRWAGGHIAMGTNVDCYQRAEGRYELMRGIISALRDAANPFSILTKGTLILRDLDLLLESAEVTDVGLNVSAGFVDKSLWRAIEPGTPAPERRLEACATLNDAGLGCGVLMGPVVPFLSDSPAQLEAAVRLAAEAGAVHVTPIVLHLRPGAREWFLGWLREAHPDLIPRYAELYGPGAYARKAYQERITGQVRALAERFGVGRRHGGPARTPRGGDRPAPAGARDEQLTLL
jgi:DNA repair photolyase